MPADKVHVPESDDHQLSLDSVPCGSPRWCALLLRLLPCLLILEIHDYPHRVSQSQPNHLLHRIRHGRGEQVRPPLFRQVPQDPLDVSTVIGPREKPVSLIEDKYIELGAPD